LELVNKTRMRRRLSNGQGISKMGGLLLIRPR